MKTLQAYWLMSFVHWAVGLLLERRTNAWRCCSCTMGLETYNVDPLSGFDIFYPEFNRRKCHIQPIRDQTEPRPAEATGQSRVRPNTFETNLEFWISPRSTQDYIIWLPSIWCFPTAEELIQSSHGKTWGDSHNQWVDAPNGYTKN